MRIERLALRDIACFKTLDLEFLPGRNPDKADIHLIVGPNGSGKSTVLMALAQFFSRGPVGIQERFLQKGSSVAIKRGAVDCGALSEDSVSTVTTIANWNCGALRGAGSIGELNFYAPREVDDEEELPLASYRSQASKFQPSEPKYRNTRFSYAAFSYNGQRSAASYELTSIQAHQGNPLGNACVFLKPTAPKDLVQWIANTKAKEAFALAKGDERKAKQRGAAIDQIESIISAVIEKPFRFVMNEEPLSVNAEVDGVELGFDVLPDGLKSILSWVADLLMRMDRIPWVDDVPVLEREFFLFLDEIEVHLHPAWQRKILPTVQTLFPNAQIFISTHSPFVIASADDAWIYPLRLEGRWSVAGETLPSMKGNSYSTILKDVLGIDSEFSPQVEELLQRFYAARNRVLGGEQAAERELNDCFDRLKAYSEEVTAVVVPEMRQVRRRLGNQKEVQG